MDFQFIPELVAIDIQARTPKEVIDNLGTLLHFQGYVGDDYSQLVLERENVYPTGLQTPGVTIAMPHAFSKDIQGTHVAIGILNNPVFFHNMEDMDEELPVEVVFMLAIGEAHEQMEMLKILMRLFKEEELLKKIRQTHQSDSICDLLNQYIEKIEGEIQV